MPPRLHLVRSSMVVGFFSLMGSLTGILVETSIAAHLGLSKGSDTFYAAFTIPYIVTNLLRTMGQFSLVPFFSALEARHSAEELWRGFSYAVSAIFLGLGGLAGLGALTAPWLVRGLAPGFTPAETQLASQLCRWLFLILLPAAVAETIRAFLFSQRHFAIPASGNFFRNLTVILSVLFGFHRLGFYSIVFGYLAGHLVQLGVLGAELLISFPVRYRPTLSGSGEAFRNLHGSGAVQLTAVVGWQGVVVVERMIASYLPPGTLTALGYGLKIMSTLSELLAGSVGTAVLPTLALAFSRQQAEEVRRALRNAVQMVLLLSAPAMVFCLMLPRQVIRFAFERGNFTPEATDLMARVFFFYTLALLFYGTLRLLNVYLFARHEAMAFLRLSILCTLLNIGLDLLYVIGFHWQTAGIPLALLTSNAVVGALAYAQNVGGLRQSLDRSLAAYALKILAASGLSALVVWGLSAALPSPQSNFGNFVFLLENCGAGTLVYIAALFAQKAVKPSQIAALLERGEV